MRPRRPSSASAAVTRSAGVAPPARIVSAPAARSASSRRVVGVGAVDDGQRRFVEGRQELRVERQAGVGVEDDADRLARFAEPGGEQRVVGEDGADADRDRVAFAAPDVDQLGGSSSPEIQGEAPAGVAVRPSSDIVGLQDERSGRPVIPCLRKGWLRRRASSCDLRSPARNLAARTLAAATRRPGIARRRRVAPALRRGTRTLACRLNATSTPSALSCSGPLPAAFVVGSAGRRSPTRARSASMIASLQGGWRPWWAQGSSVTYIVAPVGSSPRRAASASAARSACRPAELGVESLPDNLPVAHDLRRRPAGSGSRVRYGPPRPAQAPFGGI